MSQDDFKARLKRVKARSKHSAADEPTGQQLGRRPAAAEREFDEGAFIGRVLLPQLGFILGAVALVAGRSIAMNQLGIEPSTETMSLAEGAIVLVLMAVIGLVIGASNYVSHIAMAFGAALAFLLEDIYIPMMPELMETIYTPEYVSLVTLGLPLS